MPAVYAVIASDFYSAAIPTIKFRDDVYYILRRWMLVCVLMLENP